MRRILLIGLVLLGAGAFVLVAAGAGGKEGSAKFWIELDNAFGLVNGADLKVAGVRAGKITDMKVDRRTRKALIGVSLEAGDYHSLRSDVRCASKPQSLIGEYFIDCQPGRSPRVLKAGSRIPLSHTESTIPPDVLNNILRLPYKERLRAILTELGVGVASRAQDIRDAVRRGVPALRETDRVLAILARQNMVLRDLAENADHAISALGRNRANVGKFVTAARDTATASAERRIELAQTFRKLPAFLEELRPTMRALGRVAGEQTPALADLNASAGQLKTFFDELGPFAEASRPAIRSLGEASVPGIEAARAAQPIVKDLRGFARQTPEVGKNLAIVLKDLDDPKRAVENNARAAQQAGVTGPRGYSGLEALLQYVFDQSQAINVFDQNAYLLKVSIEGGECAPYTTADTVKAHPDLAKECNSQLGPTQPGINAPDPTAPGTSTAAALQRKSERATQDLQITDQALVQALSPTAPSAAKPAPAIDLQRTLAQLLGGLRLPGLTPSAPSAPARSGGQSVTELLDYLLSP